MPGEGGAGRVSVHAGDCALQGRSVPVLRRRARLERGLGRPEAGGDIRAVPAGRFQCPSEGGEFLCAGAGRG